MRTITNCHVIDPQNIGDLLSSPLRYFEFPGFDCRTLDIRTVQAEDVMTGHVILGGGGLLFERFLPQLGSIQANKQNVKRILWGVGQQTYARQKMEDYRQFHYQPYVVDSDLVGVRDYDVDLPWVPCVSCMHPAFDKPRTPQHDFVVFSHKKFRIHFPGFPTLTNKTTDFEKVLNFLGSGETILTSSFHGAYWGMLLGRKVLAFPFSSKFYSLKHSPALYPVEKWQQKRNKLSIFGKKLYERVYEDWFQCSTNNWRSWLNQCQPYPSSLEECRDRNRWFYQRVLDLLS